MCVRGDKERQVAIVQRDRGRHTHVSTCGSGADCYLGDKGERVCVCMCGAYICVDACVCVCVEREGEKERGREREKEKKSDCEVEERQR